MKTVPVPIALARSCLVLLLDSDNTYHARQLEDCLRLHGINPKEGGDDESGSEGSEGSEERSTERSTEGSTKESTEGERNPARDNKEANGESDSVQVWGSEAPR